MTAPDGLLLPVEQELHDLRYDLPRPLVEFGLREIGDRVRHDHELVERNSPLLSHGPPRHLEGVRDNRCRGDTCLLQEDSVEHTAR